MFLLEPHPQSVDILQDQVKRYAYGTLLVLVRLGVSNRPAQLKILWVIRKQTLRVNNMSTWIPVVVIEDDEFVREALRRSLKLYGFKARLAEDGPKGLKLANETKPALVLLDWMMPEMDGLEVLSELKHGQKTQDIPVFMLTARGMVGDLDQAFEIGADDYITKPLDLTQLGRMVQAKWERFTSRTNA